MTASLTNTLIIVAIFMMIVTSFFLLKGRIPEKYSIVWYFFAILILLIALFPNIFVFLSKWLGFEVMSNLVIAILIGLIILLTMVLTIMIAGQKKKTTMLIQEISILKKEFEGLKKEK